MFPPHGHAMAPVLRQVIGSLRSSRNLGVRGWAAAADARRQRRASAVGDLLAVELFVLQRPGGRVLARRWCPGAFFRVRMWASLARESYMPGERGEVDARPLSVTGLADEVPAVRLSIVDGRSGIQLTTARHCAAASTSDGALGRQVPAELESASRRLRITSTFSTGSAGTLRSVATPVTRHGLHPTGP